MDKVVTHCDYKEGYECEGDLGRLSPLSGIIEDSLPKDIFDVRLCRCE